MGNADRGYALIPNKGEHMQGIDEYDDKGLGVIPPNAVWRTSPDSGPQGGNCFEFAPVPGGVFVRDSKNPQAGVQGYTTAELRALVTGIRDHGFLADLI